jgi:hypothetical protein
MNKTHYSILAIVMVMTLGIAIAAPSAFATDEISYQGNQQLANQEQTGGLIFGSPQISVPVNVQVNTQLACVAGNIFCS